ncbi:disks large-associated protein 3-like isoform X3 [Brienomyrus brachyistius]|uniref:disks large-associated protein 3-like isoform X3 n=1 Tax=Brienomyrus brachyistius TaxID=42636 RepID=UPI0020B3596F|nr:disks large-associated protein 3-like isoform X3 [Brienomyrus brachyistius]
MKGHHVNQSLSQQASSSCHCVLGDQRSHLQRPGGGAIPHAQAVLLPSDSCHKCTPSLRQVKQGLPSQLDVFYPDGFRTLQYHRSTCRAQRSESPNRIRHLVHSVQRLFNKSHSLEDNATRFDYSYPGPEHQDRVSRGHGVRSSQELGHGEGYCAASQHALRSSRRSRSHERNKNKDSHHQDRDLGLFSSDDNIDADSRGSHGVSRGCQTLDRDVRLRAPKGGCLVCSSMALCKEARPSAYGDAWTSTKVSQAPELPRATSEKLLESHTRTRTTNDKQLGSHTHPRVTSEKLLGNHTHPRTANDKLLESHAPRKATNDKLQESHPHPRTANDKLLGGHPHPRAANDKLQESHPHPRAANDKLLGGHPLPRTANDKLLGGHPHPRTANDKLLEGHPHPKETNDKLLESHLHPRVANDKLLGGHPHPRAANDKLLGGHPHPRTAKDTPLEVLQSKALRDVQCRMLPGAYPYESREVSCQRMKHSGYIKAMAEEIHAEPGFLAKAPTKDAAAVQRELSMDHTHPGVRYCCKLCHDLCTKSHSLPKKHVHDRICSHSLCSAQGHSVLDSGFQRVCESGWGDSQSLEALDLPGAFRVRSHSYIRAIQAGVARNDPETGGLRGGVALQAQGKVPPPLPPRKSKPQVRVASQSSTDATQETSTQSRGAVGPRGVTQHAPSLDGLGASARYPTWLRYHSELGAAADGQWPASCSLPQGPGLQQHVGSADILNKNCNLQEAKGSGAADSLLGDVLQRRPASLPQKSLSCSTDGHKCNCRSCISMLVDSSESRAVRELQSIGIQVEENRRPMWFHCSTSLMDQEEIGFSQRSVTPGWGNSPQQTCLDRLHWREPNCHQTSNTGLRSSSDTGLDPGLGLGRSSRQNDAEFYMRLLCVEVERMQGWCQGMQKETEDTQLPEEALYRIRNAVENAQQFMSQKVQHFFQLCQKNLVSAEALAELWELLQLGLEEVRLTFLDLQTLRDSGWRQLSAQDVPPPLPKKPAGGMGVAQAQSLSVRRERSLDGQQHPEAHGKPSPTRQTSSLRQDSATESADDVERFITEGQTRF